jgi:chromosomal replication initiation ATPase DnaA
MSPSSADSAAAEPAEDPTALAVLARVRAHNLIALIQDVSDRRGVRLLELCGRGRGQNLGRARQELWWEIRNHPDRCYSYAEIARLFQRDHTTVRHGVLVHEQRSRS